MLVPHLSCLLVCIVVVGIGAVVHMTVCGIGSAKAKKDGEEENAWERSKGAHPFPNLNLNEEKRPFQKVSTDIMGYVN